MKLLKETEYAKYLQEISCTDCIKKDTPILPTPKISPNAAYQIMLMTLRSEMNIIQTT